MPRSTGLASSLLILVADDIPATRLQLTDMLKGLGHEVLAVDSGQAALKAVDQSSPDLVLLDLLMPGLDGFEVASRLRESVTERWLPVIVMSSLEGEEHLIYAHSNGADDYLVRPVSPNMLQAKLHHYARVLGMQNRLAGLVHRQRVIHDNIMDAVITMDEFGVIQESNLAASKLLGRSQKPLAMQACEVVLGETLIDLLNIKETKLVRKDGDEFPAELVWSSWRERGRMQYTLVIHDLTERRRIERMKDEFLATVSHELRTPLTSVMGALGLIASGAAGTLPKSAVDLADVARRNGERLGRLIDDVLDLTKLEGNQMVLHLRETFLPDLLFESVNAIQAYADTTGVRLSLTVQETCPGVHIDGDRFLQVMANLLSNALKHSSQGDVVKVSLTWLDGRVTVSVKDTGPGVDPHFRSRMFEKFSQADGTDERPQGGTGLGLYVSRLFIERMGGFISCESSPGQGALFSVNFPVRPAQKAQDARVLSSVEPDAATHEQLTLNKSGQRRQI